MVHNSIFNFLGLLTSIAFGTWHATDMWLKKKRVELVYIAFQQISNIIMCWTLSSNLNQKSYCYLLELNMYLAHVSSYTWKAILKPSK